LWQQIFLNRSSTSVLTRFPLNIVLAVIAALLSYYIIERPSLNLRRRLELGPLHWRREPLLKPEPVMTGGVILEGIVQENQMN
jgi:peptidoglycan/LPS O-acetylase OafA/YrhL